MTGDDENLSALLQALNDAVLAFYASKESVIQMEQTLIEAAEDDDTATFLLDRWAEASDGLGSAFLLMHGALSLAEAEVVKRRILDDRTH